MIFIAQAHHVTSSAPPFFVWSRGQSIKAEPCFLLGCIHDRGQIARRCWKEPGSFFSESSTRGSRQSAAYPSASLDYCSSLYLRFNSARWVTEFAFRVQSRRYCASVVLSSAHHCNTVSGSTWPHQLYACKVCWIYYKLHVVIHVLRCSWNGARKSMQHSLASMPTT